jgi:hypothetical protein
MTAQIHEVLTIDGREASMAFCPPLPDAHERIAEAVDSVLDGKDTILRSTACWRGYQGSWEIRESRFYLTGLRGRYRLEGSEPLFADWFTGVLRVPVGKLLDYVHMGFGSVYEKELHIKVERGIVSKAQDIDNRAKKRDRDALGWQNLPGNENSFPGDDL